MNPFMQIPITIGSYPILDEPPLYGNVAAAAILQQPSAPALSSAIVSNTVVALPASDGHQRPSAPFPENGKTLAPPPSISKILINF